LRILQRYLSVILIVFSAGTISIWQNIVLKQSNESGIYKKGEQIKVLVFLKQSWNWFNYHKIARKLQRKDFNSQNKI